MRDPRILVPLALTVAGALPQVAYVGADNYIRVHNTASSYISDVSRLGLSYVGLQPMSTESSTASLVEIYSRKYSINPMLIKSMLIQESAGNSDAYSNMGAIGLLQIMPENAKRCGLSKVSKLWDDENNIRCGVQIISEELRTYKGDLFTALRGYNGSPKAVKSMHPGTVKYANEVMKRFAELAYKN